VNSSTIGHPFDPCRVRTVSELEADAKKLRGGAVAFDAEHWIRVQLKWDSAYWSKLVVGGDAF
jgi:hypothetical protein